MSQSTTATITVRTAGKGNLFVSKDALAGNRIAVCIVAAALVGLFLKLAIAYNTFGTNDAVSFYYFARSLADHGLKWTYERGVAWLPVGPIFNHPPLTAYFLRGIYHLAHLEVCQANGLSFPFLLRLPGILADLGVVLMLVAIAKKDCGLRRHYWMLGLFAVSPVSLMVSGFHGNTDSVMVMFFFIAALMCMKSKPWLCGLALALSCQVKVIPLLFFPVFFLFWLHRRALLSFMIPFVLMSVVLWWEPLFNFPLLFAKNVLSYGSYWGIWGITYWLRATRLPAFNSLWLGFSPAQFAVATGLKLMVIGIVCLLAWRRRKLNGRGVMESIALGWIAFFIFSPGVCAQYLVWPAPFILLLSPRFYVWLTAASSLFLFAFYNTISQGLPWYLGVSTNQLNNLWTPWAIWPWTILIVGGALFWRKAMLLDPQLSGIRIGSSNTSPIDTCSAVPLNSPEQPSQTAATIPA